MSPTDPPAQNPYAPPASDAGLSSGPPSAWVRPPAGDLDAALRGELRLRLNPVFREAWAAVSGNKLVLNLTVGATMVASIGSVVGLLYLILLSSGQTLEQFFATGQVPPEAMSPLVVWGMTVHSMLQAALFSLVVWGAALRRIEPGPRGPWGPPALRALPRLLGLQVLEKSPTLLAALLPATSALSGPVNLIAGLLSMLTWLALVWSAPLVIDRGMGVIEAAKTSIRLLPRTVLPLTGLWFIASLVYGVVSLTCGIGLIWAVPWMVLLLGAAWRQLAGLQGGFGVASGAEG